MVYTLFHVNGFSIANFKIIFRTLVAYLIFYRFWWFFFFFKKHTHNGLLLFYHFPDRLGYCLVAFSKLFEHLKQQNICPPL
jgi:ABC-type maltose transport system permease subunit